MNAPTSLKNLVTATRTTTVFTSGNSQAVRLPKEFRLNSKTVEISRRGGEIVLREKPQSLGQRLADVLSNFPPLSAEDDALVAAAFAAGRDTRPPQERDFSWMDEPTPKKTKLPRCKT
jgi:antitoxin VapB